MAFPDGGLSHGPHGRVPDGKKLREFLSGDTPHESNYTKKGDRILHASIGCVCVPADLTKLQPVAEIVKGEQLFQIVDNKTFKILKKWDMGQRMDEAGYPGFSSAVRPMTIAPDQRFVYLQFPYLHGVVEFDTKGDGKVTRVAFAATERRSKEDTDLAVPTQCRTSRHCHQSVRYKAVRSGNDVGLCVNRKTCWMSVSGLDKVVAIDYAKAKIIKQIAVGDHRQRVREGMVCTGVVKYWRR